MPKHVPHRHPLRLFAATAVIVCALSAQASPFILGPEQGLTPGRINAVAELPGGAVAIATHHGLLIWKHDKMHRYTGPWFNPL